MTILLEEKIRVSCLVAMSSDGKNKTVMFDGDGIGGKNKTVMFEDGLVD